MEKQEKIAEKAPETQTIQMVGEHVPLPELKKRSTGLLGMPSSMMAEAVGVGMAALTAGYVAWNSVKYSFYRNMERYDVFTDIKNKRDESYRKLYKDFAGTQDSKGLTNEMLKIENEYTKAVEERFESFGIKNTFDRWKTLKYHQRNDALLAFGAVGAVLLGMVAGTAATRRVEEHQDELERKLDQIHAELDHHNSNTMSR